MREGRGAHWREQIDPHQPPMRRGTERLAPAAEVAHFCCCYESRIGAEDAADDVVRRPRRGHCCRRRSSAASYRADVRNNRLGHVRPNKSLLMFGIDDPKFRDGCFDRRVFVRRFHKADKGCRVSFDARDLSREVIFGSASYGVVGQGPTEFDNDLPPLRRALSPSFPAGEMVCSLSLGGGCRRFRRGASRPARAAGWPRRRFFLAKSPCSFSPMMELVAKLRGVLGQPRETTAAASSRTSSQAVPPQQVPVPVEVHQPPSDLLALARTILMPVLHPLATAAIIFVVTIFILIQQDDLRDRLIRLFGSRDLHRSTLALDDAARRLSRFYLVQLGVNAAFGIIIGTGLYFIGLPSPLLWGTVASLLRFVPYIGSYLGAGFPILVAGAVDPGWSTALWVAGLFLLTEPIMGQLLEPMLYGRSTGLSPISVVVSAIFWTWLWGPVGLILSTPITLCLVVLGQHVEQLEFLNVLFGDRPALSSIEIFYQRALAGDLDELQEHAEDLLKKMSLSSYYDNVGLKGLELAAIDLARGVLPRSQVERIKEVVTTLVDELSAHDDVEPAANGKTSAIDDVPAHCAPSVLPPSSLQQKHVRCIAGRGQLDEAAATMLVQLLQKHDRKAEVVTPEMVSRSKIANFDSEKVSTVCVCYIDVGGSTSSLRFLLRRLRHRIPDARLIVAFWPQDHPILSDQQARGALDADDFVTSLREVLNTA